MSRINHVVVAGYGRSAIAKAIKGALRNTHPIEFGAEVLQGVLKRVPQLDPKDIDDIIVGCAMQDTYQSYNFARLIAACARVPREVPAMTVNRFCSSGLQTIALGAGQIASGMNDIVIAGGVESMSLIPMNMDRSAYYSRKLVDIEPDQYLAMGFTAENVAARYGITREEMDAMAVESHHRAAAAQKAGKFAEDIIPVHGQDADGNEIMFCEDQGIRPNATMESLGALKPCFKEDGIVTAGTSSQMSDGASFVVLMSEEKAAQLGIQPIAKFIGFAAAGCESGYMGEGPIHAVPKVMEKTGLTVADMDVIEINEAFAAQALPSMRILGMDPAKTNPNGGALAFGHPLGATGAILSCKVMSELQRTGGKYGLVTMCVGGGMGAAGIYEMC